MLINVIRPVPAEAISFVKAHEGCRLTVYADAGGVLTVGYGHTSAALRPGQTVTQVEADAFLLQDLSTAAGRLETQIGSDCVGLLTENQYAALLSFSFNLGVGPKPGAKDEWQIWKLLRLKQFAAASDQFSRFNKAGGKVLSGLVTRRADEQVLFMAGAPETVDAALPSSVTRSVPTPPTPIWEKPLSASKRWIAGLGTTGVTLASAVAPQIKNGADKVSDALSPYVGKSDVLAAVSNHLAMVAAAASVVTLFFIWLGHHEDKQQ